MRHACVKWDNTWSYKMFTMPINFAVRQGSVLSAVLFTKYVDDVAKCSKYDRHICTLFCMPMIGLLSQS